MQNAEILALAGLRVDGRRAEDLRTIRYKFGVVPLSDGSVYFEQGLNKVLVMVHGPQEHSGGGGEGARDGVCSLSVSVENAPFSGTMWKAKRAGDRRTAEMETLLRQTLEEVVMLELYPKSEIAIVIHVLETDGSVICAILNAVCLALVVAGVSMNDMLVACSIGLVKEKICQDCTQVEQSSGGAYFPVAMKARSEDIIMLQLTSRISLELLDVSLRSAVQGCRKIREIFEDALKDSVRKRV